MYIKQLFCTETTCLCLAGLESRLGKTMEMMFTSAMLNTNVGPSSTAGARNPIEYMDRYKSLKISYDVTYKWKQVTSTHTNLHWLIVWSLICFAGDGHNQWLPLCIWRYDRLHLQYRSPQTRSDDTWVDSSETQQPSRRPAWRAVSDFWPFILNRARVTKYIYAPCLMLKYIKDMPNFLLTLFHIDIGMR